VQEYEAPAKGDTKASVEALLPLLFAVMLEHRDTYDNFEIPTKKKHDEILKRAQSGKAHKRINRDLKAEPEQAAGAEGQNFVLTGKKNKAGSSRGRYVHQEEVFAVLIGFLRKEPTRPDTSLQHAGKSLKEITAKQRKEYCNIPDEVIKDLFRALDLCYHLFGIQRPPGMGNIPVHPDLPQKHVDRDNFRSKLHNALQEHPQVQAQFDAVCRILGSTLRLGFDLRREREGKSKSKPNGRQGEGGKTKNCDDMDALAEGADGNGSVNVESG
jgi:hypothetical protein